MLAALRITEDMKPAIAEEGRLIFANVTLIPRLLGPDLSIDKLKFSYANRKELKPANTTNTYMVLNLQRTSCVYEATVVVTYELFNVLNYVEEDKILERAASDAWKAKTMPNMLDRAGYVETMHNMISSESLTHVSKHLVSAIANRGDDLKERIEHPQPLALASSRAGGLWPGRAQRRAKHTKQTTISHWLCAQSVICIQ